MSLQILRKGENEMAKKEVKTDLWVARQLDDSKIKYDAQGSDVKEINDALQSASKRGTGNAGYPEYVAIVKDFVIVIEDKADLAKHQKLTSTGILSVDQKDIADYAVNGAYFYAKHIAQNSSFHKIFAIGVSGDEKHHRITPLYVDDRDGYKQLPDIESFTSFTAVNIDEYYTRYVLAEKTDVEKTTEEILKDAAELHEYLRTYGSLKDQDKPLVVSGILLALDDKFFKHDDLLGDETTTDGQLIYDAIKRRLKASNIGPDAKRDKLMSEFSIIRTSARLNEVDAKLGKTPLKFYRKTNSLLAGLAHCPHCGRRLSVISESDRWTNGKPRFKYVCPGYRKKECNFKAVDGVLLDEFVVQQLSELSDENSERFRRILEIKIEEVLEQSQTVQEHNIIKKKRDKLKADIAAQTRNLREVDGSIKQFIQEDLQNLAEELRETERQLSKLDEGRKNNMIAIRDLEMTKEKLLSFAEYAKDAQPEVLVTLIQTIVERIYIVDKDDERYCHIFIKGCSGEDYTGFFQTAGYIEQKTTPVCDSEQHCICT